MRIDRHRAPAQRQAERVPEPVRLHPGGPDHRAGLDPLAATEGDSAGIGGLDVLAQAHVDTAATQVVEGPLRRVRAEGGQQPRPSFNQDHPDSGDRSDDLTGHRS